MRPSIAAALSTLGPIHSADAVLLRPADVSRFDDLKGEYEATDRRIIERPDGSLILMLEFDPTGSGGYDKEEVQFALVGAVPEGAWMWADPKLRAPKAGHAGSPDKAEIYLFADHLDALARGESVTLGGVTVTAGPGGQDRLNRPTFFGDYVICVDDLDDLSSGKSVTASDGARFRVTDKVRDVIRAGLMSAGAGTLILERADLEPLARGEIVESPAGGTLRADPEAADALRRALAIDLAPPVFTEEVIAAFNEGAERLRASKPADRLDMRPTPKPAIRVKSSAAPSSPRPVTAIVDDPEPIVVASLDGRTLGSLTAAEEAAIPDGAEALPPSRLTLTFTRSKGQWISPEGYAQQTWDSERVIRLPKPARTPKNGDRLDSFTAAELDALPVGARFVSNTAAATKNGPKSWKDAFDRQGIDYDYTSAEVLGLCGGSRTLVLPAPEVKPVRPVAHRTVTVDEFSRMLEEFGRTGKVTPAAPKVGDLLRNLTPEQRANLPIGTVLAPDLPSKPTMTKGADGKWHDTIYPTPVETQFLNFDRPIHWLPDPAQAAPTPAPAAAKAGDRWGDLAAEQRQSLPVGTVIKEEGCITVAVWTHLPSGWSKTVVDTASSVLFRTDTGEPTKTSVIVSIPAVSK